MKREIITTEDGSSSILIPEIDETYHSRHGAIQESRHVFIENGIKLIDKSNINIFEMGLGTGLNALLTMEYSIASKINIYYESIESEPLDIEMIKSLNFNDRLNGIDPSFFNQIHTLSSFEKHMLEDNFVLLKIEEEIQNHQLENEFFDVIYFDAFGPKTQPELWEYSVLENMYQGLKNGGLLSTYCAQGKFKRTLKEIGFRVKNVPGPPGKREMTLAWK